MNHRPHRKSHRSDSTATVLIIGLGVVGVVAVAGSYMILKMIYDTNALGFSAGINYIFILIYIIGAFLMMVAGLIAIIESYFELKK